MEHCKPGKFVARKTEREKEFPVIWKIKGQKMIQKHQQVFRNGKMLYEPSTIHSAWSPEIQQLYQHVRVKFYHDEDSKRVMEFVAFEKDWSDPEVLDKTVKELEKYKEGFRVYIQILVSCVLDASFISQIPKGSYFEAHLMFFDRLLEHKKVRVLNTTHWVDVSVRERLAVRPLFTMIACQLPDTISTDNLCVACDMGPISHYLYITGHVYDRCTLRDIPDGPEEDNSLCHESLAVCAVCADRARLYHEASHYKYTTFHGFADLVLKMWVERPGSDMLELVQQLVSNTSWIDLLLEYFQMVMGN